MKHFFDFKVLFIFVLILLNLYALYSNTSIRRKLESESFIRKETFNQLQYSRDQLRRQKQNVDFYLKANRKSFPFIDSFHLGSTSKPVLVLRVHSGDCNNCVNESLHILKEKAVINRFRIVVLANFSTRRSVEETFPLDYPTYIVPQINSDSITGNHRPYYFIISEGKMSHFFVPEWDAMDLFRTYISQMDITFH